MEAKKLTMPKIASTTDANYKSFFEDEYKGTGVRVNSEFRKFEKDNKAIKLEVKDFQIFNGLRSKAREDVFENVRNALLADALKSLKINKNHIDWEYFTNILDLDDFEGTDFSGILTLNEKNDINIKYAIPVEMKINRKAFYRRLNQKISQLNKIIETKKSASQYLGNLEQSLNLFRKIGENFKEVTLSFDQVTEISASLGKGNHGPNAPHVGIELGASMDVKKCFHSIIPQFREDDFNKTVPGRIQNNEGAYSVRITMTKNELIEQGIIELDAKMIFSSTSKFNNFLIVGNGAQNEFYKLDENYQNSIPSNKIAECYTKIFEIKRIYQGIFS